MPADVQCKDCGFLAMLCKETRELAEVDGKIRNGGPLPIKFVQSDVPLGLTAYDDPTCSVSAYDLASECGVGGIVAVLGKPRKCERFVQWHQGFSPKEHREMKLLQEVEIRTQAWQRQQEALAETRHQELRKDQKQFQADQKSHNWKVVAFAVIGSLVAAIIGGLVSRQ